MFKPREVVHQTQKEMFHLISKQQALIHQTRGVFQLRSKHREVIHQKVTKTIHIQSSTDFVMPGILSNLITLLKKFKQTFAKFFAN